ncbi:DegT/DnrJ/EryC1/StrS family aminotransferase [Actinokineospora guangxiensis]|uniref:DegT/DnrJ/EryC1/StrS family aminotransferase n=1 Tax=Actinokineospora guangxiensis TaxID=1490288 RepID=A0ABW0EMA4_9PSEU
MINVFQPTLGEAELAAVGEVFASGWVGRGPRTKAFIDAFGSHIGVAPEHLVSVTSCTEGLFLAMEALGVGPGDEVVLPAVSFVGAANAIAARGATPVFCDVDPRSLNPAVDDVERRTGPRTRAVLVLHYGGSPGGIAEIAAFCRERGVALVEDAACSVASAVGGTACGTFGDIGVWSFDPMKIVVGGDGGMMHVPDPALRAAITTRVNIGMSQESGMASAAAGGRWWEFDVRAFGRRSFGNDVLAAIAQVQLSRLPEFLARRSEIAKRYDHEFADLDGVLCPPPLPDGHRSSHYLYWLQLAPERRDALAARLFELGIYTTFRYLPLHRMPVYGSVSSLPGAESAADRTLCLPLHQGLDDDEVGAVVDGVRSVLGGV